MPTWSRPHKKKEKKDYRSKEKNYEAWLKNLQELYGKKNQSKESSK